MLFFLFIRESNILRTWHVCKTGFSLLFIVDSLVIGPFCSTMCFLPAASITVNQAYIYTRGINPRSCHGNEKTPHVVFRRDGHAQSHFLARQRVTCLFCSSGSQSEFWSHAFTSSHLWAWPITALVLSHWWQGPVKHLFNIPWLWSQSRSPKRQSASSYQLQVCGVLFQRSSQFDTFDTSFSYMSACLHSLQYLPSFCILDKLNTGTSDACSFFICLDGSNNLNGYQTKKIKVWGLFRSMYFAVNWACQRFESYFWCWGLGRFWPCRLDNYISSMSQ